MLALLRSWHPLERSTSVSDSLGLHTRRRFRAISITSTSHYNCATCTATTPFAITIPTNAVSDSGTRRSHLLGSLSVRKWWGLCLVKFKKVAWKLQHRARECRGSRTNRLLNRTFVKTENRHRADLNWQAIPWRFPLLNSRYTVPAVPTSLPFICGLA